MGALALAAAATAGCFRDDGFQATSTSTSGTTGPVDLPPAACGDGVVEGSEECDQGAKNGGPECAADCTLHVCGDRILAPNVEECDDGPLNGKLGAACTANCTSNVCGDGHVGPGEACDAPEDPSCTADCAFVDCGDGVMTGSEECDDGNLDNSDACTNRCTLARCGDGVLQAAEQCDDGNIDPGDACTDACMTARCGDGQLWIGEEECDDGNIKPGDQCSPACTLDQLFVFVSSVRYDGALGGLSGADKKCQQLAEKAGLQGTYRAWLSDGENTPMMRFKHGLPYVRIDKQPVADDLIALQTPPTLRGPINMTEGAQVIAENSDCADASDKVWTNLRRNGEPLGELACARWTRSDGMAPAGGGIGSAHAVDQAWSDSTCAYPCSMPLRLYCFQQAP